MITNDHALIRAAMEEALAKYTTWLNAWHEDQDGDTAPPVTRDSYNEYDDPPRILNWVFTDRLMVTIYANPYHDEGGPTILTAIFQWACEVEDYEYGDNQGYPLELEILLQSFDTSIQPIYMNGEFQNSPGDQ